MAAIETAAKAAYPSLENSLLVALFLISNVFGSLLEPYLLKRYGLRGCVVVSAMIMAMGNLIKSGVPGYVGSSEAQIIVAFLVVGLSQPVFQITALVLAQDWFPTSERNLVTAVLVNSNYLGIGAAYILGAIMVGSDPDAIPAYMNAQTAASAALFFLAAFFFKSKPPLPPSRSAAAKARKPPPLPRPITAYWSDAIKLLLSSRDFALTVSAFCASAAVSNVVAAEFSSLLEADADSSRAVSTTSVAAAFEGFMVTGSLVVGWVVNRTHAYRSTALLLLGLTAAAATTAAACLSAGEFTGFWCSLLLLGGAAGPIMPLQADLGVEVVYPRDENEVLFVNMIMANATSTAIIWICFALRDVTAVAFLSSLYVLAGAAALVGILFAALFRGQYNRLRYDLQGAVQQHDDESTAARLSVDDVTAAAH
ncbi:major facilitator superfamily domain-containing protein [Tribonema minus]|uniref:Major facilitator superfamily domain-containing protein n=1 Tax=Tribonema minus TaxID=303371 RepID=A0A836CJW2_9STRA|nr:major facilitator superfamily domain-containing protein [Tribonema minus]